MAVKKKSSPSFEESLESLRKIVSELEQGKLTLGESLERYESGVRSLRGCYDQLQEAQRKIEKLVKIDSNGNLITEPFDDQASHGGQRPSEGYGSSKDTVKRQGRSEAGGSAGEPSGDQKSAEDGKQSLF